MVASYKIGLRNLSTDPIQIQILINYSRHAG